MTYCTDITTVKAAKKAHRCTWCSEPIEAGTSYKTWRSFDDSCNINKMHQECEEACRVECSEIGEDEYVPFDNERPKPTSAQGETQ